MYLWSEINLLGTDATIADNATEVVDTPGLVESKDSLPGDHLIAGVAEHAKELLVMQLAIGQTLLLVVSRAQEGLLTTRADKVLHVPRLAQRVDYTLLNWTSGGEEGVE